MNAKFCNLVPAMPVALRRCVTKHDAGVLRQGLASVLSTAMYSGVGYGVGASADDRI